MREDCDAEESFPSRFLRTRDAATIGMVQLPCDCNAKTGRIAFLSWLPCRPPPADAKSGDCRRGSREVARFLLLPKRSF
jgi:hypothetical protein